jgi:hypothetical protein
MNEGGMKKTTDDSQDDEMGPEYDLRGGIRGKYYEPFRQGTNIVLLDRDVARVFGDSATVNDALRRYLAEPGDLTPGTTR